MGTDATRTVDGVPLPTITIAGGAEVTEGFAAVFTLSRTGDAAEALTVTVEVRQEFAVTVTRVPDKLPHGGGRGVPALARRRRQRTRGA